ncbi:MAG TPA: hypothetical protein V6C72_01850, partial [Chroococcales cyanobacterium]
MADPKSLKPSWSVYAGLFTVAMATLMYEILLTRIFSVTMWYHFAFMAISIAMFGMTLGAIIVYLGPRYFTPAASRKHLALSSLLFALTILISFVTHLLVPFIAPGPWFESLMRMVGTFVVIALPFIFSGIAVCISLTRFRQEVSKLYAADICGAAVGCLLLVPLLNICDAPSAVFIVAALAALSACLFAGGGKQENLVAVPKPTIILSLILAIGLAGFGIVNAIAACKQDAMVKLRIVHGYVEKKPLYEKWNSFSRVIITAFPENPHRPAAWGLSNAWPADKKVDELDLTIDAGADTVLTKYAGDPSLVEHLKFDLTNLVHYIRHNARVLIVGVGGGRDVLSALVFNQRYIQGVEINNNIIDATNRVFGDYTGHLDGYPQVHFANDEARSYIARLNEKFDIIQISLIDTAAATAAGAFVLTEHS